MTRTEYNRILSDALHRYGHACQIVQTMEEMAELTIALSKWRRFNGDGSPLYDGQDADSLRAVIAEELADVQIMIDQMIMAFHCGADVNAMMQDKAERLRDRMAAEGTIKA